MSLGQWKAKRNLGLVSGWGLHDATGTLRAVQADKGYPWEPLLQSVLSFPGAGYVLVGVGKRQVDVDGTENVAPRMLLSPIPCRMSSTYSAIARVLLDDGGAKHAIVAESCPSHTDFRPASC